MEKTDNELVLDSLRDQRHYAIIVERYNGKLSSYIRRISGLKTEDVEDVLQEVFIKAYYNLNSFKQHLKFSSWIYRIAHNTTMSELRKRHVRPLYYYEENDLISMVDAFYIESHREQQDFHEHVRTIIQKMDEKYKDVLTLKFLEEKDYKEISDILKIPEGTVATRINRAKKKFRDLYENP